MNISEVQVTMTDWAIPLSPRPQIGYSGEHAVCEFEVLTTPEDGITYYLEVKAKRKEPNTILLTAESDKLSVKLTSEMLGEAGIKKAQVVAYLTDGDETPIKKSNVFELEVKNSINATKDVEGHYQTALEQWSEILAGLDPQQIAIKLTELETQVEELDDGVTDITELACRLYKFSQAPLPQTNPEYYPGIRNGDLTFASGNLYFAQGVTSSAITWQKLAIDGETTDYTDLTNKPQINDVELSGNKSLSDLGVASADDIGLRAEHLGVLIASNGYWFPNCKQNSYPVINTVNKTLTIQYDTLLLLREEPYYKQLAASAKVIDFSNVNSSAIKIYFKISKDAYRAVPYNTKPGVDEVLICTLRKHTLHGVTTYACSMSCPFLIDGDLYGLDIGNEKADVNTNINSINHRGYNTIAPENTLPAYRLSRKKGFRIVETDVCFTSDGVAVLLHDTTINRTARNADGTEISETINIADITYEQALTYDFGIWKSSDFAGTKIPTFEEFLILCRNLGLHPYIEVKVGTQAQIESLVDMVRDCGMKGKVTWISFINDKLTYIKDYDNEARLGKVVNSINATVITNATNLKTTDNEVFIDSASYTADEIALCKNADIPLEIWTIDNPDLLASIDPYITGVTSDNTIAGARLYNNSLY